LQDADLRELAQLKSTNWQPQLAAASANWKSFLVPRDADADRNVIVEIRQGSGGEEAALWAADLFRMYSRYAETRGWKVEPISLSKRKWAASRKSCSVWMAKAPGMRCKRKRRTSRAARARNRAKGPHSHQRRFRGRAARSEEVDVDLNDNDIEMETMRSSGAGGQSVQKNETAVRLIHRPSGLVVTCQDERSLRQNKEKAMRVLRSRLYEAERERQANERDVARRAQVKSGDRSDKIRTYNFPENRLTDHRINFKSNNLDQIMQGRIDELVNSLAQARRVEALQNAADPTVENGMTTAEALPEEHRIAD
jgi:peptide chain release factor 1